MSIWIAISILLLALILTMIRAMRGPTPYDRVLAVNSFGSKTIMLLVLIVFITGKMEWLDLVLIYALINFVAIVGVLKFFRSHSFARPLARRAEAEKQQ